MPAHCRIGASRRAQQHLAERGCQCSITKVKPQVLAAAYDPLRRILRTCHVGTCYVDVRWIGRIGTSIMAGPCTWQSGQSLARHVCLCNIATWNLGACCRVRKSIKQVTVTSQCAPTPWAPCPLTAALVHPGVLRNTWLCGVANGVSPR